MKRWTVMLVPHERGSTRTLHFSAVQIWTLGAFLIGLSFMGSFLYGRHVARDAALEHVREAKHEQERSASAGPQASAPASSSLTPQERIEIENRVRAEYEASIRAITDELGELYDADKQARRVTGIAPRTPAKGIPTLGVKGGKGGGTSHLSDVAYESEPDTSAPPSVIYGMSHPSADLIIQEINLRTASLRELVGDVREKARQEVILHVPAIWPALVARQEISSPFGYRKDPFNLRVGHHDGTDIAAPFGASVVATANGVVLSAGSDGEMGNLVKIDHGNGIETWYAHMSSILVHNGQTVERKDVIGKVGSTGRSTGPHLHYEVHVGGRPVDPGKYFGN